MGEAEKWVRRVGFATLIVAVLANAGCGSGSASMETKVADKVEKPAAQGTGSQLDLAAVQKQADSSRFKRLRMTTSVEQDGVSVQANQTQLTVDKKTKRTETHIAANDVAQTTGLTERGIGSSLYLKADDAEEWVKLSIDPSLTDTKAGRSESSSVLETLTKLGADLKSDGTEKRNGSELVRYTGTLDWIRLLEALKSTSELSRQFFSQMPEDQQIAASANVLVDASGSPRHVELVMQFVEDGSSIRIVLSMDYLSTKGIAGVAEPGPSKISKTVPVHSSKDLQREISRMVGGEGVVG